jgi:sugar phosphate isomerase/epimerase
MADVLIAIVQGDFMLYSRRELGKMALATLPAAGLAARPLDALASMIAAKPDSKVAGVQIGLNVPYDFGNNLMSGDDVLDGCIKLGVSAVELRSQPVELFMGVPQALLTAPPRGTPPDPTARKAVAEDLRKWRASAPMSKARDFRKKYEDAGVLIQIVKFDNILNFTDEVLDYAFELAKTLGATAISCELPVDQVEASKRLGRFADKHKIMIGFHGHATMTPAIWEQAFTYAKYNGANLDIGHFIGGNKTSPVPFLKKHHDRITHLHIKDKTLSDQNVPFGKGDTPIKEVLQLIRDNKWKMQATIEFEYPIPPGSDRMTEIGKCVQFCRDALA